MSFGSFTQGKLPENERFSGFTAVTLSDGDDRDWNVIGACCMEAAIFTGDKRERERERERECDWVKGF
ncbi:hypothetical protein LguiA_006361 [Lonicera macranthoides]